MKPKTPEAPPPPPSALDERNRKLKEGVLTNALRKGYSSTILTHGMRTGIQAQAQRPTVTGMG